MFHKLVFIKCLWFINPLVAGTSPRACSSVHRDCRPGLLSSQQAQTPHVRAFSLPTCSTPRDRDREMDVTEGEGKFAAASCIIAYFLFERSLVHCLLLIFEYKVTTVL